MKKNIKAKHYHNRTPARSILVLNPTNWTMTNQPNAGTPTFWFKTLWVGFGLMLQTQEKWMVQIQFLLSLKHLTHTAQPDSPTATPLVPWYIYIPYLPISIYNYEICVGWISGNCHKSKWLRWFSPLPPLLLSSPSHTLSLLPVFICQKESTTPESMQN